MTTPSSETEPRAPLLFGWEVTNRCNLTCPHCYTNATRRRQAPELTTAQCRQVIDELVTLGTRWIGWTGGEPLLRDDLEDLARYALDRGDIRSGLTTNGVLLDERRVERLAAAGIRRVQVSLDGSTVERNAVMRRATPEQFARAVAAVRHCVAAGFDTYLAMVLCAATLDDAPVVIELAAELKVKAVRFCGFVPQGRGARKAVAERLTLEHDLGRLGAFISAVALREDPVVLFDPAFGPTPPDYRFHECVAGREMMYLATSGFVFPCTSALHPRFAVGRYPERTLTEIWHDPRLVELAEWPRAATRGPCRRCPGWDECQGACKGVTCAATGDPNRSFPFCLRPRT